MKGCTYANFGGIRLEDMVLVNDTGAEVLTQIIPKTISQIEQAIGMKIG